MSQLPLARNTSFAFLLRYKIFSINLISYWKRQITGIPCATFPHYKHIFAYKKSIYLSTINHIENFALQETVRLFSIIRCHTSRPTIVLINFLILHPRLILSKLRGRIQTNPSSFKIQKAPRPRTLPKRPSSLSARIHMNKPRTSDEPPAKCVHAAGRHHNLDRERK